MKPKHLLPLLFFALLASAATAQNDRRIEEQKRVIATLEKRIAEEERQIGQLQKGRAATEERVRRLARQIGSRNQLLGETERQARLLREEIARKDSVAGGLATALERTRTQYAVLVREAYRNYRHNDFLTYIFSSHGFRDAARRIAALREMAALRERKLQEIETLDLQVREEQRQLADRQRSLDSVSAKLSDQKNKLERDARTARSEVKKLTQQEKTALKRKSSREQELEAAVAALRKLTKGNTAGASFSSHTSGLRLPVEGGRVKRYKGNMAEIAGPRGARVVSIYEGKVVEIKRNRITDKYDVFVAHGEYITSYANLAAICVEKGGKVAKNAPLGTIGATVDPLTLATEYKLVFGIYAPDPSQRMLAENCFRK